MLFSLHDANFEQEDIQEKEVIGPYTCVFSILLSEYDEGLGENLVIGFSVRTYPTETPDEGGMSANFDSFLEARAYFEYAKSRISNP